MMKKLFLLVLSTIVIVSCKEDKKDKPVKDYMVLSGKIYNLKKKNIVLKGFRYEKKIKFNKETKKFSDTIRDIKPGYYTLIVNKRQIQLYLDGAKNLKVIADAKKRTKSPKFKAPKADSTIVATNKYILRKKKRFLGILGNANKLFSVKETTFLKQMDKYKKAVLKLINKSKLPEDFIEKEKRNLDYEYIRNVNNYETFHRTLTENEEFVVSDKYPKDIVKKIDFNNNDDYNFSFSYRILLKEYLDDIATENTPDENGDYDMVYLETVDDKITDQEIKDDLLYEIGIKSITYAPELHNYYNKLMSCSKNEENNKEFTELYEKLKLTAKGMPSPKFNDYENYGGGKTSLDDIIGKGKYVYIDIWATWCGFCQKEVPLLKNFERKYHGKNVDFVSISVDSKKDKKLWEKIIKEKEMGGVQLFAGTGFKDLEFAQKYLIIGLPRFILLDPDGKIVTPNAPRPSQGYKLDAIFEKHGIKPN